jgi:hypothetical protein
MIPKSDYSAILWTFYSLSTFLYDHIGKSTNSDKAWDSFFAIRHQISPFAHLQITPAAFQVLRTLSFSLNHYNFSEVIAHIICQIRAHFQSQTPHSYLEYNLTTGELFLRSKFIYSVLQMQGFASTINKQFFDSLNHHDYYLHPPQHHYGK